MKNSLKFLIKFIISFFTASIVSVLIFVYEGTLSPAEEFTTTRKICDGTFVSGIIFLCSGFFLFLVHKGAFNFLSFTFYKLKKTFSNIKSPDKSERISYSEYCALKKENSSFPWASFCCGILFLTLSFILALI